MKKSTQAANFYLFHGALPPSFLVDGGLVHLKTDSNFLFTYTRLMVEKNQLPMDMCTEDLYHATPSALVGTPLLTIQTYYEKMWMERGLNIRYLRFHLPKQGTLVEPDVEIPPSTSTAATIETNAAAKRLRNDIP